MSCTDLLAPGRIAILDRPVSCAAVFGAAARLLARTPSEAAAIAAELQRREAACGTGIGHGVAVPHVRHGDAAARGAFLLLRRPLDFAACDGAPVDLVFALCVPEDRPQAHLQCLAELAGHFCDADFRERLRAAPDAAALGRILSPGRVSRRRAA